MPESAIDAAAPLAAWQRFDAAAFLAERALDLMIDRHLAGTGPVPSAEEFALARRLRALAAAHLLRAAREQRLARAARHVI